MSGFKDPKIALAARDAIASIVRSVIDRERPKYRYGTVQSIDRPGRKCMVTFTGDSSPVRVAMGSVQPASTGQVVRVGGIGAERFIEDIMGDQYLASRVSALETADGALDGRLDIVEAAAGDHETRLDDIEAFVPYYVELVRDTSYTVNNNYTSLDQAGFWTEVSDAYNMASNGIVTIPVTGVYSVTAAANVAASVTTGRRIVQVERIPSAASIPAANTAYSSAWTREQNSGGAYVNLTAKREGILTAGDRIRVLVYQSSGGAYVVNPVNEGDAYFTVRRVRA